METVTNLDLSGTLAWLCEHVATPVDESWVPGASVAECRALSNLGAVASYVLGANEGDGRWPEAIRRWLANPASLPARVAAELDGTVLNAPDESLARLYASVVDSSHRRVLGTFFTPQAEVTPMLDMWEATQATPTTVIDVGAGVGVFTAAAAKRWKDAHVLAVDVNPITLGLLGVRMALPDTAETAARVELVLEDYTTWFQARRPEPRSRRLILGNPPYTRAQLLPLKDRARLVADTVGMCGTRSSLSTFITALTLNHLNPDDGLCLLLPAQWLESEYARDLRKYLLQLRHRRVELRLAPSEMFSDAVVDAVILLVGAERPEEQPFVVSTWEDHAGHTVDRGNSTPKAWRSWFKASRSTGSGRSTDHRLLDDVAVVRRGTATGANGFFVLSDDDVAVHELPPEALRPVVRRLTRFDTKVTQARFDRMGGGDRKWILVAPPELASDDAVARYLKHGESLGVNDGYLCRIRRGEWYDVTHDLTVPDVIVTAMTRGGVRIVENDLHAAITNNLYGLTWRDGTTKRVRAAVLTWLRSQEGQESLLAQCRSQGHGLRKFEPKALANVELPGSLFA